MTAFRGYSLIEVCTVILVVLTAAVVVAPTLVSDTQRETERAGRASIAALTEALESSFRRHRAEDAPAERWITGPAQLQMLVTTHRLDDVLSVTGAAISDNRGYRYQLVAETASQPARLVRVDALTGRPADPNHSPGHGYRETPALIPSSS